MKQVSDKRRLPVYIDSDLDDLGLDPYTFRIYAHLARRVGGGPYPLRVKRIAEHCRISERMVRRGLKTLRQMRLIGREDGDYAMGQCDIYYLTDRSEWLIPGGENTIRQEVAPPAPQPAPPAPQPAPPAPYAGPPCTICRPPLHHMQGIYKEEGTTCEGTPHEGGKHPRASRFSATTTTPVNPESEILLDEIRETVRTVFGWKLVLSARSERILEDQVMTLAAAAVKPETIREYAAARRKEIWHAGFADDLMTWMNRKDGGGGRMTPERRAELEREMAELYRRPYGKTA